MILEKSFLLSEMEDYEQAFCCFNKAFFGGDDLTKKESNFNTHLWILMKYLCQNPGKGNEVI